MKKFLDTEHDTILTLEDLHKEYEELKASGDTDAETFGCYMSNCLSKNGTLEEIR